VTDAGFERFVGIDWSGRKGTSHSGIQIAEFSRDDLCPKLIRPVDSRYWSRSGVAKFINCLKDRRTLVGIDFAFSVPAPCPIPDFDQVRNLWAVVDKLCLENGYDNADYYAEAVWASKTSPFREYFRYDDHRGKLFDGKRLRRTEQRSKPRATSVYKLMYSQVGRGSFAGMRVLRSLSQHAGGEIAIWPFDKLDTSALVIVEVYPSAFYPLADCRRPNPKKQTREQVASVVDKVLCHFGATCDDDRPISQDEIDAYVTSAALAHLSKDASNFSIPSHLHNLVAQEGWIFGVSTGDAV
jgi:hypothetical protein